MIFIILALVPLFLTCCQAQTMYPIDPLPPTGCKLVRCPPNYYCEVNSANVASCLPIQHPGECPPLPRGRCQPCCTDGDCADDQKCCNRCCRKACNKVACKCPYGTLWSVDANGCAICTCLANPCDQFYLNQQTCPYGYRCEPREVTFFFIFPIYRAECVPICPNGGYIANSVCNATWSPCHSETYCSIPPGGTTGSCCLLTQPTPPATINPNGPTQNQ